MDNDFFYPIHDIIPDREGHGVVIGKNGSLTYVVRLSSPEVYSLYKDELATRHAVFVQAFFRKEISQAQLYDSLHFGRNTVVVCRICEEYILFQGESFR